MVKTLNVDYEIGTYNTVEDMIRAFNANEWQIPEGGFIEGRDYETFQRPKCCSTCLWHGIECIAMSNYKKAVAEKETDIICAHWAYYD